MQTEEMIQNETNQIPENQKSYNTQENGDQSSRCSTEETQYENPRSNISNQPPVFETGVNSQRVQNSAKLDGGQQRLEQCFGTYAGRNQYRSKIEQLNQRSQGQILDKRNKKRQNFIKQKRQMMSDSNQENMICNNEIDDVVVEPEQISSKLTWDQALQNKSHVFRICSKIKTEDYGVQCEGIGELKDFLFEKSQRKEEMRIDVFEIIETGVSRILLRMLKTSADLLLNQKITQIFINLALGDKREVQKLVNSGLIEALGDQIFGTLDRTHVINCIWSLSNIALTHIDFRNQITKRVPSLFKMLDGFVVQQSADLANLPLDFYKLQSEIIFFISSMVRQEHISVNQYLFYYSTGIEILGRCLKSFNFFNMDHFTQIDGKHVLKDPVSQYLFDIIQTFCTVSEIQLLHASEPSLKMPAQHLDQIVNQQNLFTQILRILQSTTDQQLLEKTWQLIGSLCCCNFTEHNVRNFFKDSNSENLIKLIHVCLNSQSLTPKIMKNIIFTLSNIIADKYVFLEQIVQQKLIEILKKLWDTILEEQNSKKSSSSKKDLRNNETYMSMLAIKNEIIYCIGNCVIGIQDSMVIYGLDLLKHAIQQGALQILTQALDYKNFKTDVIGVKVALDGLNKYFQVFKRASKSNKKEIFDGYHNYFEELTYKFETEFNGLDLLENCQNHPDHHVYKMAQKILVKYFQLDNSGDDEIIQLIDKLSKQGRQSKSQNSVDNCGILSEF